MHTTPQTTRQNVLAAIAQFDSMGRTAFLKLHGFGASKRFTLRFQGRSYDSKAILGAASGLTARQFSGGAGHTVRVLRGLGFTVRDGQRVGVPADIRSLVAAELGAFPFEAWTAGSVDPSAYFASGLNTAANIRAFGAIGHDVGVAFPELREGGIVALSELAGSDVQVFVDSGAFSEVKFTAEGPVVVKPLDHAHWLRLLATYKRLAIALGGQLHVVAPDMVGHQAETLERLARYAPELRELEALGARVLVPVQKGAMGQVEFWNAATAILGAGAWVPALPCKKAATTQSEAVEFCAAVKPMAIHLLGLGTRNRAAAQFFDGIAKVSPATQVQCDSCMLAAHCNKDRRYGMARARGMELIGKAAVAARTMFQVALAFGVAA
jgi:hypothetical protein